MAEKKDLRGSIGKMREVAQLLSGWADDMERSLSEGKAGKKAAEGAVPAVPAAPAVAEKAAVSAAPTVTVEQVRGILAGKCATGFKAQVQALINSFGASRFSEVDPSHYAALLEAVEGLGGEPDAG